MKKLVQAALGASVLLAVTQASFADTVALKGLLTAKMAKAAKTRDVQPLQVEMGTRMLEVGRTFRGEIGFNLNPSAYLPSPNAIHAQANFVDMNTAGNMQLWSVNGGSRLGDYPVEVSLGVSHLSTSFNTPPLDALDETGVDVGAKYQFMESEDPMGYRGAVGGGYSQALLKNLHAYLVFSRMAANLIRNNAAMDFSVGARYDQFEDPLGMKSCRISGFGAVRVPLNPQGSFRFIGEIQSENKTNPFFGNPQTPYSVGVEFVPVTYGLNVKLAWQRHGIFNDSGLALSVGGRFGSGR